MHIPTYPTLSIHPRQLHDLLNQNTTDLSFEKSFCGVTSTVPSPSPLLLRDGTSIHPSSHFLFHYYSNIVYQNYYSLTMAIFQQQQRTSLFYLVVCFVVAIVAASSSSLRGQDDTLRERVTNPTIRDDIRGKTLKELGVVASITTTTAKTTEQKQQQQGRRKTQDQLTFNYFSIYDEFGPFFVSMGDTAGCRGNIYNTKARDDGLLEEYVEGALQGTCSVVASSGKQLCSYEFFLLDASTGTMGTIVATGSVLMELNKSNILIIEATGDDFIQYNGGMITLSYTAIGEQTVMDINVQLDRR